MNLNQKTEVVEQWKSLFQDAAVVLLSDYSGMKADEMAELRKECRNAGVTFKIVKNTLAKRAIEGSAYEFLGEHLKGTVAIAMATEDQTAPAKVLVKQASKFKALELLSGGLEGRALNAAEIDALSKMPGRDELRGSFLGLLNNVPAGFLRVLNAVPGGMVNVLDAKRRKMEEAA